MMAFPAFDDGDVRIIIAGSRQYILHATILKNISPLFRTLLDDVRAANLSSRAIKRGVIVRFRIDAVTVDGAEQQGEMPYVLVPIALDEDGKAVNAADNSIPLDLENGRAVPPYVLAFEAVLGAFYNLPISLGDTEADSMMEILSTMVRVTEVAEYLGCVQIITHAIEATLLATSQLYYRTIARDPVAWLDFAFRIKSRPIFRESLIHAAGQYQMPGTADKITQLAEPVAELLHKKARLIIEAMKVAQNKITTFYPQHMQRQRSVGLSLQDSTSRASYGNDIMSWIAIAPFRQYFTQNLAMDQTHHAPDMGWEMVDIIMTGGDKYLNMHSIEQFGHYFPMSHKARSVIEGKLEDMKHFIKVFVKDLAVNESHLDIRAFPVEHFTCTNVSIADYPWETGYNTATAHVGSDDEADSDDDSTVADTEMNTEYEATGADTETNAGGGSDDEAMETWSEEGERDMGS